MKQMITLVRRELIEHRSSWIVTAAFGALFVFAAVLGIFGIGRIGLNDTSFTLGMLVDQAELGMAQAMWMVMLIPVAMLLAVITAFVVAFYLLDSLYAERKDRSILFWKSMPVSDLQVVGSKYLSGLAAIPGLTVAVFAVTAVLLWLIVGLALLVAGAGEFIVEGPLAMLKVSVVLVYALLVMGLWYAPIHGWLLLVSAFARRFALGWALLPPILVMVAERIMLGTNRFRGWVGERMSGGLELAFSGDQDAYITAVESQVVANFPTLAQFMTPGRVLASPALWIGLALGLALLAGAVLLRRWRDEA